VAWGLGAIVFVLLQLAALVLVPLGLPGTWLQVAIAGVLAWIAPDTISSFTIVVVLALGGELSDVLSGRWGTRRFGGSARAGWGALLGGFAGLLVGEPVPIVGPLAMSFVGTFVGAVVEELSGRGDLAPSLQAGWGALVGRAVGVAIKLGLAFAIAIVSFLQLLSLDGR